MARNLQPIVAISQQLIVERRSHILQLMVAKTRDEEKMGFSRRLTKACDALPECPPRGRPAWLQEQLKPDTLSVTGIQNWFSGTTFPEMANIARLAKILRVDSSWLLSGPGDVPVPEFKDIPELLKIMRAWPELGDDLRKRFGYYSDLAIPLPNKDD